MSGHTQEAATSPLTFADLTFGPRDWLGADAGEQAKAFFPNGYGVSVIRGYGSYGNEDGLYELAVLQGDEADWSLCYSTPVTGDVEGHLTPDDVSRLMADVAAIARASGEA